MASGRGRADPEAAARVPRVTAAAEVADDGLRALVDATHTLMALLSVCATPKWTERMILRRRF